MDKQEILDGAKKWFRETIAENHIKNTKKLAKASEFNINPFLTAYLANFLVGNSDPKSIAKALIYPRALGTSITTSFGTNTQKFTTMALGSLGSAVQGIDIEFIDALDGRKKYCQLKAGPNTINKDDVETIHNHFSAIKRLSQTNNLNIAISDMVVGVLYGNKNQLSTHYKNISDKHHYPVLAGQEFWHHMTGDEEFYKELTETIAQVANEFDGSELLEKTIEKLAQSDAIKNMT